jgi:hypothetical protein
MITSAAVSCLVSKGKAPPPGRRAPFRSDSLEHRLGTPGAHARTVQDWWEEIETDLIGALATGRPVSLGEVARKIGMSEAAATSLLCSLAQQGKVHIRLVELA